MEGERMASMYRLFFFLLLLAFICKFYVDFVSVRFYFVFVFFAIFTHNNNYTTTQLQCFVLLLLLEIILLFPHSSLHLTFMLLLFLPFPFDHNYCCLCIVNCASNPEMFVYYQIASESPAVTRYNPQSTRCPDKPPSRPLKYQYAIKQATHKIRQI